MDFTESATTIAVSLLQKSGVREWEDVQAAERIANTAGLIAALIQEGQSMALPDYFKVEPGTAKTIKNSGGDAAITLASLANGSYRQSATLDLGSNWARLWQIDPEFELAATPTAGNAINLYGSFHSSTGAGKANTSGSDAAYTGYSSNAANSVKQLEFLGAHICTVQATTTVQKSNAGVFFPKARYLNLVVENGSGAAFHSTDTNQVIKLTPLEELVQDAV